MHFLSIKALHTGAGGATGSSSAMLMVRIGLKSYNNTSENDVSQPTTKADFGCAENDQERRPDWSSFPRGVCRHHNIAQVVHSTMAIRRCPSWHPFALYLYKLPTQKSRPLFYFHIYVILSPNTEEFTVKSFHQNDDSRNETEWRSESGTPSSRRRNGRWSEQFLSNLTILWCFWKSVALIQ